VGLPGSRRINLGRFLAGQHQESSLDVGVVLAWRWALWTVFEAFQAVLAETMAPDKDGAYGQIHLLRDRGVGLTVGDTQDDLGTIRVLLGRCARGHAALQFGAFGGQQTNTSTTGSATGHVQRCFGCFVLHPGHLYMNSIPTSTNRTWYWWSNAHSSAQRSGLGRNMRKFSEVVPILREGAYSAVTHPTG
jgi:hypothetical protein